MFNFNRHIPLNRISINNRDNLNLFSTAKDVPWLTATNQPQNTPLNTEPHVNDMPERLDLPLQDVTNVQSTAQGNFFKLF
jgi:hypothetical protein